jgi:UDP-N-acetylglucosamine diphosphorylase/glucosamine-1-phosphate N-acetyltransferase
MKLNLDDNGLHLRFAPLTLTRPVGGLRCGILTNAERWKFWLPEVETGFATEEYLSTKFPALAGDAVIVNAAVIPTEEIAAAIVLLEDDQTLVMGEDWIAKRGGGAEVVRFTGQEPIVLRRRWELYSLNDQVLVADFFMLTAGRESEALSETNTVIGDPSLIFLEEGANVEACILNTTGGPVYVGKNAEIMEGSMVRGPFALCDHAVVKMGSKIYGATTIGPECRVGGEVNNVVFQAYSNKGHDGFLGNALVGEWCNFGADSNTSNLKNNYSKVRSYDYESGREEETGEQFMGVCMGDHSKCGINTMFNTATVVGVSCNIYGGGFPDKLIPSFTWGGVGESEAFKLEKAIEAAEAMMSRRGIAFTEGDRKIFGFLSGK